MNGHRLIHVPARNVRTIADLPRLGDKLSGEDINPAMQRVMNQQFDWTDWLTRLRASGAEYFVDTLDIVVPETDAQLNQPLVFQSVFSDREGFVYRITWTSPRVSPGPGR
jgi:hypothetical protein